MLENLAESFDIAAEAFLQEQQGLSVRWLNRLLIGPSIVAFAKMLAPNHKLANQKHVTEQRQIIGGTNQFFSPKDEQSRDLSRLAMTPTLEHQHLWASTSYDPFYNVNKRFV